MQLLCINNYGCLHKLHITGSQNDPIMPIGVRTQHGPSPPIDLSGTFMTDVLQTDRLENKSIFIIVTANLG